MLGRKLRWTCCGSHPNAIQGSSNTQQLLHATETGVRIIAFEALLKHSVPISHKQGHISTKCDFGRIWAYSRWLAAGLFSKGHIDMCLAISSAKGWYGRVQGPFMLNHVTSWPLLNFKRKTDWQQSKPIQKTGTILGSIPGCITGLHSLIMLHVAM